MYLERAAAMDEPEAQALVAEAKLQGDDITPVPQDVPGALAMLQQACAAGGIDRRSVPIV